MKIERSINGKKRTFTLTSAERYAAYQEVDENNFQEDLKTVMKGEGYKVKEIKLVLKNEEVLSGIRHLVNKYSETTTFPEYVEYAIFDCKEKIQALLGLTEEEGRGVSGDGLKGDPYGM